MEESINNNNIRLFGYTFSIETALVVSIFSIGIVILIIGLIIDSKSPHIKKPIQRNFQLQTHNTKNTPTNSKSNNIIANKIANSTNNIEIESLDKKTIKNTLVKLDSNYSKDDKHVYFGQQEQGNSLLNLNKDKIKIVGDYITDGNKLYNKSQEIQLGSSNIDLNNLQKIGKTYLRDNTNVYASVYTYNIRSKITTYRIEKLDLDVNHLQFFLDEKWEYIKDNDKVYYLRGDLYIITTLNGGIDKNGRKKWTIEGDTRRVKGQLSPMEITNTDLIDFIKGASSVYVKDIQKINDNYSTDGEKIYYTEKNTSKQEIRLGDYNIDLKTISTLGKFYIKDKNNIYAIVQKKGGKYGEYGIKKLDLNIKYTQFLSGQYEYINYDNNIKKGYREYIKDKDKIYYMRAMDSVWIVKSMIEVPHSYKTISMSGEPYNQGDKKWKLLLGDVDNNHVTTNEFFTNKTIIDFVSTINSVEKKSN